VTRLVSILLALACVAPAAHADEDGWRLDLGAGVGAWLLDPDLEDYRWQTTPSTVVEGHASLVRGRWAFGLDARTTATVQQTGLPGVSEAPDVDLNMFEVHGAFRALRFYGTELWGRAHAGRMHVRYQPDRLSFDNPAGGAPIDVEFSPINEWIAGAGLSLRREFVGRFALAGQVTHSVFALDTAHRRNDEIIRERQTFQNWSFGIGASWLLDL
jgi:hypothetical protein